MPQKTFRKIKQKVCVTDVGIFFVVMFLLGSSLFPLVCRAEEVLKKKTFIPLWSPQAQFAGYYVAYEKGSYRKYGLDVSILPGGPVRSPWELLHPAKLIFVLSGGANEGYYYAFR